MSLINQVLSDLEKRKKETGASDTANEANSGPELDNHYSNQTKKPKKSRNKRINVKKIILLVILVILIIVVIYWWQNITKRNLMIHKKLTSLSDQQTKVVVDAHNVIKEMNKPVELTQALFKPSDDSALLILQFDRHPKFQFTISDNMLEITLTKATTAHSVKLLPNEFIQQSITKQQDDNIILKLMLAKNIMFTGIEPEANNLVLTLTKTQANSEANSENNELSDQAQETINNTGQSETQASATASVDQAAELPTVATLTPEQQREQAYQAALDLSQAGQQNKAIAQLKQLLLIVPEFYQARKALAIIYLQKNQAQQAYGLLSAGLQNRPNDLAYIELMARTLLLQKQAERALTIMQTISPEMNEAPDFYALLAVVQQQLGNYLFAAEIYQQLVTVYPRNGTWWVGLGISLQAVGQNNAAAQAYQQAINTKSLTPNVAAFAKMQVSLLEG